MTEPCYNINIGISFCVIPQLQDSKQSISFELESLNMRPDPEPLLMEMIHSVSASTSVRPRLTLQLLLPKFVPVWSSDSWSGAGTHV